MNSEPDLLRIEVVDDEIVVSLAKSQLSAGSCEDSGRRRDRPKNKLDL
jgi:hypothetical protein